MPRKSVQTENGRFYRNKISSKLQYSTDICLSMFSAFDFHFAIVGVTVTVLINAVTTRLLSSIKEWERQRRWSVKFFIVMHLWEKLLITKLRFLRILAPCYLSNLLLTIFVFQTDENLIMYARKMAESLAPPVETIVAPSPTF